VRVCCVQCAEGSRQLISCLVRPLAMLTPNSVLRLSLTAEFVLIALYLALPSVVPLQLPSELQAYLDHGTEHGWAAASPVNSFVSIPLVVVHIISAVALWFFRRWARVPYVVSSAWAFIGVFFGGPPVQHAAEYALEEAWIFLSGFSSALAYFAAIQWHATSKA
jgi:hypothetical protein